MFGNLLFNRFVKACIFFVLMLLFGNTVFAELTPTIHSTENGGAWNNPATWVEGRVPLESDVVEVNGRVTHTLERNIQGLLVGSGASLLRENSYKNMTINGNLENNGEIRTGLEVSGNISSKGNWTGYLGLYGASPKEYLFEEGFENPTISILNDIVASGTLIADKLFMNYDILGINLNMQSGKLAISGTGSTFNTITLKGSSIQGDISANNIYVDGVVGLDGEKTTINGDLYINTGGKLSATRTQNLTINGNITNKGDLQMSANIWGNIVNQGNFGGFVTFFGTDLKEYDFTQGNSSISVQLGNDIRFSGVLKGQTIYTNSFSIGGENTSIYAQRYYGSYGEFPLNASHPRVTNIYLVGGTRANGLINADNVFILGNTPINSPVWIPNNLTINPGVVLGANNTHKVYVKGHLDYKGNLGSPIYILWDQINEYIKFGLKFNDTEEIEINNFREYKLPPEYLLADSNKKWKVRGIALLGGSDYTEEKCINVEGCLDGTEIPDFPEINNFNQYILPPLNHEAFDIRFGQLIGKERMGSGIYLSAHIDNSSEKKYKLEIQVVKLGEDQTVYTGTTDFFQTGIGSIQFTGLGKGNYSWKTRIIDEEGNKGLWTEAGLNEASAIDFSIFERIEPYKYGYSFLNKRVAQGLLTGGVGINYNTGGMYKIEGTRWEIFNSVFPRRVFDSEEEMLSVFYNGGFNDDEVYSEGNCFGLATSAAVQYANSVYMNTNFPLFYNQIGTEGNIWNNIEPIETSFFLGRWNEYNESLKTILAFQLYQKGVDFQSAQSTSINTLTGTGILNRFKEFPDETYIISFSGKKNNTDVGHTVVPYKVEENRIYVWDNNYPFGEGEESSYNQYIEVNLETGAWENQSYKRDEFNEISLVNIDDFIINDKIGLPMGSNDNDTLITLAGSSDMLVTDSQGRKTGFIDGLSIDEIPGIDVIIPFNQTLSGAIEENRRKQIYIPEKRDITITITGTKDESYNLIVSGGDYTMNLMDVETKAGEQDMIISTRENVEIDFDRNKTGIYDLYMNNFQDKNTDVAYLKNITSISEPQKYTIDWNELANNAEFPIEYQIDQDNNGDYETVTKLSAITADIDAPETNVTFSGTGVVDFQNTYEEKVTIRLDSTDNLSGLENIYYSFESSTGSFIKYGSGILVDEIGTHTFYYYSTDIAGNKEEIKEIIFYIISISVPETGKIYGYVYNDRNNNGRKNGWEKTKKNWKVYIDMNNDGKHQKETEPFMKTKRDGYYEFDNLENGTYIIRVFKRGKNYKIRTPKKKYYKVKLGDNKNIKKRNFGIRKYKW